MANKDEATTLNEVSFCSSLEDDVWHRLAGPNAFESWHFDAVSDDGREAIVVTVYDNYVLSPRFVANSHYAENVTRAGRHRFPAVSLTYSRGGRHIIGAVNEFVEADFSWSGRECKVGESSFRIDSAEYGSGFVLKISLHAPRGRRIVAEIEWLLIEADLAKLPKRGSAVWNAAVPRADVTGRIELRGRDGGAKETVHFRGTGYHDQVTSSNVHYRDLSSRMWGRAHFVDSTLIFDRLGGVQNRFAPGKLYIIKNGAISEHRADCSADDYRRDRWGLRVPHKVQFTSDEGIEVLVRPTSNLRSGFSEVKTLSQVSLRCEGRTRSTVGLTEFVNPARMRSKFYRWISDLRIGRKERSPLF
jgi:hypothetical protein